MLPGQMSLWQLSVVEDDFRKVPKEFDQNLVSNKWDNTDIDFVWWVVSKTIEEIFNRKIGCPNILF